MSAFPKTQAAWRRLRLAWHEYWATRAHWKRLHHDRRAAEIRLEDTTGELRAELDRLFAMPDSEIDTSDIPEQRDWSGAVRGKFSGKGKR